jgi:type IV pilus assembly protein PilO
MNLTLAKLPWHTQIGLFVGLSVAATAVFYFLYASPAREEMAARQRELASLRLDINKGMAIASKLRQFKLQVGELEVRLEGLKAVLPGEKDKDFPDLLRRIQTLAIQSNVVLQKWKPASAPSPKELHAEWPIELQLDGTYHNLGMFFDRMSKLSRIINVSGLLIKEKTPPEPMATITAQCVATTFILLDTPPKPTTPGKKS